MNHKILEAIMEILFLALDSLPAEREMNGGVVNDYLLANLYLIVLHNLNKKILRLHTSIWLDESLLYLSNDRSTAGELARQWFSSPRYI